MLFPHCRNANTKNFIPNFSSVAAPLLANLSKKRAWV